MVSTRRGKGTRLYDAFDQAYRAAHRVKGRKAVIMLTDGVDSYSERRTYDNNRRAVEESDVLVYPVRFDTRAETEQLLRAQARGGTGPVDLGGVLGPSDAHPHGRRPPARTGIGLAAGHHRQSRPTQHPYSRHDRVTFRHRGGSPCGSVPVEPPRCRGGVTHRLRVRVRRGPIR